MIKATPLYISPKGGSIICFSKASRRVFQVCYASMCRYSRDLHSAKKQLQIIESNLLLESKGNVAIPPQRKTTLKWNHDGELSEVDKVRILTLLAENELTECELDSNAA